MNQQELLKKIAQIEELARDAIAEHPNLGVERLRMILAYARYLRIELIGSGGLAEEGLGSATPDVPPRRLN